MKKPDWKTIKTAYARGEGSCRELAGRFGVSESALQKRCNRDGWKKQRDEIVRKVSERVESELVDEATAWIKKIKASCEEDLVRIKETYDQLQPAADPVAVRCLTQSKKSVDDMMRRSLNLPDSPQKVELSGGVKFTLVDLLDDDLRDNEEK